MRRFDSTPVYVIAEAGVNHNGSRDLAIALIDAAALAGADAVKFQTFIAARLASDTISKAEYQKRGDRGSKTQLDMLKKLELPYDWHYDLRDHARSKGIDFLTTAFDYESLSFVEQLDLPVLKVPSGELVNGPLLWRYARTGKPLIVSTGMSTLSEVEQALAVIAHGFNAEKEPASIEEVWLGWSRSEYRDSLIGRVTLLHCTSRYPTPVDDVNLLGMDTLADAFDLPVGYSDHTEGIMIPVVAVARGAVIIEKHFTLDRRLPGPDQVASIEPDELSLMVSQIRDIRAAMGDGRKAPRTGELEVCKVSRQQVVASRDIPAGKILEREDLTTARCGAGIPPVELWGMVGQVAHRQYVSGEPFGV